MKHKLLMVAVVLSLLVFPAVASAQPEAPRLLFSHFACAGPDSAELHFVLQDFGGTPLAGTFVEWTGTLDGAPVSGSAPWVPPVTGGVAHYRVNVPVSPGAHTFVILTATIALPGWPVVQLANPQTVTLEACTPMSVIVNTFTAGCAPGGATLAWEVSTELFSTSYTIHKDGVQILNIPSNCPGCAPSASYSETVLLPEPSGTYTVTVWNGVASVDTESTTLSSCTPTAVAVASFTAAPVTVRGCICENRKWVCNGRRLSWPSCRPPRR